MTERELPSPGDDDLQIAVAEAILQEFSDELQSLPEEEWSLCRLIAKRAIEAYEDALWRPIESAPRGTRYILAWSPERKMAFQVNWTESISTLGQERQGWTIIGESSPAHIEFTLWREMTRIPSQVKAMACKADADFSSNNPIASSLGSMIIPLWMSLDSLSLRASVPSDDDYVDLRQEKAEGEDWSNPLKEFYQGRYGDRPKGIPWVCCRRLEECEIDALTGGSAEPAGNAADSEPA